MIRKLLLITILAVIPFFATGCSSGGTNGGTVSVVIDLDGVSKIESVDGFAVQKISKSALEITGITSIRVKVYTGTEDAGTVYDETFPASSTITADVPSGDARVFKLYGLDSAGDIVRIWITTDPVNLVPGEDATIYVSTVTQTADADFTLSLKGEDGVSTFADPGYLKATGTTFEAVVYKPVITYDVNGKITGAALGTPVNTVTTTGYAVTLTGSKAYPLESQIVIVKGFTTDGTIASIGLVAISNLSSGTNSTIIPVMMIKPGRIKIENDVPITSVDVKMNIAGTEYTVATSGTAVSGEPNALMVSVPNHKMDIGTGAATVTGRNVSITVNGTTKSQNTTPIEWKAKKVTFQTWIWADL